MKYQGIFHGTYQTEFSPNELIPGRLCHVYAGLGGAFPGMFREFFQNAHFRDTFEVVDNEATALGLLPISNYILRPELVSAPQLHLFQMLSIFSVQVAIGKLVVEKLGTPDYLTGHSFGETALLVVGKVIALDQMAMTGMLRILSYPRMHELGGMVAVGATSDALGEILKLPHVYLANVNSSRQVVLSFHNSSEKTLLDALKLKRLPFVKMDQLPHPYHSPLLNEYRLSDRKRIQNLRLNVTPPNVPIYSGTTQSWITEKNYHQVDWPDLLSRQIFNPVDFSKQVSELRKVGTNRFYEIGPGHMSETFLKGIIKSDKYVYRSSQKLMSALLDEVLEERDESKLNASPWFKRLRETLAQVTGYQKEEITLGQRFQDDLGIDSLKKAEILLGVFSPPKGKTLDFNPDRFDTIHEVVEYLENHDLDDDQLSMKLEPEIEYHVPSWERAASLQSLNRPQMKVVEATFGCQFFTHCFERQSSTKEELVFKCTFTHELNLSVEDVIALKNDYEHWVHRQYPRHLAICFVDLNAENASLPLAKLFMSLVRENSRLRFCHISTDAPIDDQELILEFAAAPTVPLKFMSEKRYVRAFERLELPSHLPSRAPVRVVALGGSRGIGLEILKRFPVIPGDQLVLVGRTSAEMISSELDGLRNRWPIMKYVKADARNADELEQALARALPDKRVDCLLNLTGQELSQNFESKLDEEIRLEFESKLLPLGTIASLKKNFEFGRILHFSSIVAQFGNMGQSIYAYANALMERSAQTSRETAIAWGPWYGVGMTSQAGIIARHQAWGLSLITPEIGADLAHRLILTPATLPAVIVPMDHKEVLLFNFQLIRNAKKGGYQNLQQAIFLQDIEGRSWEQTLATSYYLAHVLSLWGELFKKRPSLRNINFREPLSLNQGKGTYKYQICYRRPFQFKIFSTLEHFSCDVESGPEIAIKVERPSHSESFYLTGGDEFALWSEVWEKVLQRLEVQAGGKKIMEIEALQMNDQVDDRVPHSFAIQLSAQEKGPVVGHAWLLNKDDQEVAWLHQVRFA